MLSSGMLQRVDLVRTDVLEERITSIIKATRIRSMLQLLVTANVSTLPILVTLMMEATCSSETLVFT
jgi:hypothetical protein